MTIETICKFSAKDIEFPFAEEAVKDNRPHGYFMSYATFEVL